MFFFLEKWLKVEESNTCSFFLIFWIIMVHLSCFSSRKQINVEGALQILVGIPFEIAEIIIQQTLYKATFWRPSAIVTSIFALLSKSSNVNQYHTPIAFWMKLLQIITQLSSLAGPSLPQKNGHIPLFPYHHHYQHRCELNKNPVQWQLGVS